MLDDHPCVQTHTRARDAIVWREFCHESPLFQRASLVRPYPLATRPLTQNYISKGIMTTGHRLFCKEFACFNTMPCRLMPLLVQLWLVCPCPLATRPLAKEAKLASLKTKETKKQNNNNNDKYMHIYIYIYKGISHEGGLRRDERPDAAGVPRPEHVQVGWPSHTN